MKNTISLEMNSGSPRLHLCTPEWVLSIAEDFGKAEIRLREENRAVISVRTEMVNFTVFFYDFDEERESFESLQFNLVFAGLSPSLERINHWNYKKRFAKAYLDDDGDLCFEMDLFIGRDGAPESMMRRYFKMIWELTMMIYIEFVENSKKNKDKNSTED